VLQQATDALGLVATLATPAGKRGRRRGGLRTEAPILDIRTHQAPFVSVGQVAAYWCYAPDHVRRLFRREGLAALRVGRDERYRTVDVAALEARLFAVRQRSISA
jgi:hypothetical protein